MSQVFLYDVSGVCSIGSMLVIGYDRYNVIVKGFNGVKMTYGKALGIILCIWIYSVTVCVPPFLGWGKYALGTYFQFPGLDWILKIDVFDFTWPCRGSVDILQLRLPFTRLEFHQLCSVRLHLQLLHSCPLLHLLLQSDSHGSSEAWTSIKGASQEDECWKLTLRRSCKLYWSNFLDWNPSRSNGQRSVDQGWTG